MDKYKNKGTIDNILFIIPMWPFAVCTVSLPAVSLAVCFITAFIFKFEDVNETMCEVKNYIPSISAVTGITPQTYLWRTSIALHSAPRFIVTVMHYNYYLKRLHLVPAKRVSFFRLLIKVNFCLNFIENSCLVLVAYITNRENYPVHEKIFVVFMITSIAYMVTNTILFAWCNDGEMTKLEQRSFWWKKAMLVGNTVSTAGLIFFFIQHRLYCIVGAFSMFSLCEYFIAYTNMAYHFTAYFEFSDQTVCVGNVQPETSITNGTTTTNNNKHKSKVL